MGVAEVMQTYAVKANRPHNGGEGVGSFSGSRGLPPSLSTEHESMAPPDGFLSLMGRLTGFLSNTTTALVDDSEVLGARHLEMGNVGPNQTASGWTQLWVHPTQNSRVGLPYRYFAHKPYTVCV